LLPADLLVQFEPWRSQFASTPRAHWDPLVWDGIAQYYPWRLFAAETLRRGLLPLWNPYQFCGTPFIANGQSAVFYPLNLVFWLLPVARAFAWSAWLHLALTGWFAYLLLRRLNATRVGAITGALVWQGNGFFIAWMHLPTVLCTATWLPLALLLSERALLREQTRRAAAVGAALGLCALAGHPQIFLYIALLTAAYLIARILGRDLALDLWQRLRRLALTAAVAAPITFGLASVQLLPTLALLRIAHRTFQPGPESYQAYLNHALPALHLTGLIIPHPFGHPSLGSYIGRDNYAEFALFLGPIALALALWSAIATHTWHTRFLGLTVLITFLLALGTPLNWPFYHYVPGIARSGGPGRLLLLALFSLSLLAGFGADRLARSEARRALPIALLILSSALIIVYATIPASALATIEPDILPLINREASYGLGLLLLAFISLAIFRRHRAHLAPVALTLLLACQLLLASKHHLHITPTAWVYPPIEAGAATGRVMGNAADWPINRFPIATLPPNSATVYHLRDAFGYDSLYLAHYRDFAAALQHGDPSPPLNGNMLLPRLGPVYGLDMMSLAGVASVLSPVPVRGLTVERADAYYTYSNPHAWPRAWVAQSAIFAATHPEALARLEQLGPMPDCVIITGEDLPADERLPGASSVVDVKDISPNAVEIDLGASGGGYLFLADAYAPGWRASADEWELPVRPANVAFRVVAPPQDTHKVTFRYEPDAFRIGLFASLLAAAALGAVGAYSLFVRNGA